MYPLRTLVGAFLAGALSTLANAGPLRLLLLDHSQVRGDAIFLSDLLPEGAPRAVREAARKISLGTAPQNGASRQMSRASLLATLSASGMSPASFVVPEFLIISRASHQITREEVYAAIQNALAGNKFPEIQSFAPADLALDAAVFVPEEQPELEVTQMAFDEFLGRARFRIWARSVSEVNPFFATARVSLQSAAIPSRWHAPTVVTMAARSRDQRPLEVEANRLVTLHLHAPNAQMLLEVRTLQRGRFGDVIRVRLPGNGKTLQARVVGRESLDATF